MKKKKMFPGMILIGFGIYFLLNQMNVSHQLLTWPTLLLIIGTSFLAQGYTTDRTSIFPGVLLTGLGIHFHGIALLDFWPNHWAIYPFIISIAYLLSYQKTKNGLILGLILFAVAVLGYFYEGLISWMGIIGKGVKWIEAFWPVTLILIGVYLLFWQKK